MRVLRARQSLSESGAAAVELAIVLPLILMILLGITEFGRAYNARVSLQHAVREGVRVWALTQDASRAALATRDAATSIAVDPARVTTTTCTPGQPTSLTVEFDFTYLVFDFTDPTLTATGTMRCSG